MIIEFSDLHKLRSSDITFVMGTFDILHTGHIHFLEQAKAAGKNHKLLVGIISDKIVREQKGANRPVTVEGDRAEIINALKIVDYVFVAPDLPIREVGQKVIETLKPEYSIASKDDWENRSEDWATEGTNLILIDKIPERSTTKIVQKIRK